MAGGADPPDKSRRSPSKRAENAPHQRGNIANAAADGAAASAPSGMPESSRTASKNTFNSYKRLPLGEEAGNAGATSMASRTQNAGSTHHAGPNAHSHYSTGTAHTHSSRQPGQRSHARHAGEKLAGSYLGTKIQPAWETRSFNINPVTSDDLSRFLRNEQHTQRWSVLSQLFYILFYNVRRFPLLWSIFIFLCETIVPIWLPPGAPRRSWYSSAVPLLGCLFLSLFVNLIEFKKRYNLGRFIDNKRCILLKDGKLSSVRSGNVVVGNILKLNCDEQVPADAVVLYSTNPDGALYLDTCYLDGQTDLKTKYSVKDSKMECSLRSYHNLRGNIICDKPCPDMERFSGLLKIRGYPRPSVISIDNFIMRGSILRNTGHIYAVVVYTGPDTKASQNFLRILKPIKVGCLEHTINKISIILGLIYLFCAVSSVVVRYVSVLRGIGKFNRNVVSSVDSLLFIVFRFVVIYAPIIPTTLPAVMDLVRLLYLPFYDSYMGGRPVVSPQAFGGRDEQLGSIDPTDSCEVVSSNPKSSGGADAAPADHAGSTDLLCNDKGSVNTTVPKGDDSYDMNANHVKSVDIDDKHSNNTNNLNNATNNAKTGKNKNKHHNTTDKIKKMAKNAKKARRDHNNNGTWTLNSGLCEELGLVDFIFTDKTGTLTTNNLTITLVTVLGKSYTPRQLVQLYRAGRVSHAQHSFSPYQSFHGRFPYPGEGACEEGGSSSCATSAPGSSSNIPVPSAATSITSGEGERLRSFGGHDETHFSTHPIDRPARPSSTDHSDHTHSTDSSADEAGFAREHLMRMLCICNPCLNVHDGETAHTISSAFNTTYSRASSFKLNTMQVKSYTLNAPSLEFTDSVASGAVRSPSGFPLSSSSATSEQGSSSNIAVPSAAASSSEAAGAFSEQPDVLVNISSPTEDASRRDDATPESKPTQKAVELEFPISAHDSESERSSSDALDELPMFKKSKSKAHFGTVSYINLDNPKAEGDAFETESMLSDEKHYLNCISKEDECMVNLANESGYLVLSRSKERIAVNCNGNYVNYELLGINEFTSSRKRMSVVVTNLCNSQSYLYVKGEANSMLACIGDARVRACVESRLKKNSLFGYRVIICGYRTLGSTELLDYQAHLAAGPAPDEQFLDALEHSLEYLGIIMFRDKIQRDITATIDLLMDAGIRIWVLTGDNKEATIQTCYLTRLLNVPTRLFYVQVLALLEAAMQALGAHAGGFERPDIRPGPLGEAYDREAGGVLAAGIEGIASGLGRPLDEIEAGASTLEYDAVCDNLYNKFLVEKSNRNGEQMCLVIEGRDLDELMRTVKGQNVLVNMACSADVVLGCLLTPVQKGRLVQLVRSKLVPTPITLAIGDGVNDIQMLQQAHISVCLQSCGFTGELDEAGAASESEQHEADAQKCVGSPNHYFGLGAHSSSRAASHDPIAKAHTAPLSPVPPGHPRRPERYQGEFHHDSLKPDRKTITNDVIGYCDFCIDNFSNLTNLLFLQGTRILRAMSLVIYFTLFKGLILVLPLFYYQMFTNWVGLDLYGSFISIVYNLFFTLVPLVFVVLFHQDVNSDLYKRLPVLYTLSRRRIYLNITNSLFWIAEGIIGSLVTYFPVHILISTNDNVFNAEVVTNRTFGLLVSLASIIIFNTRLLVSYTPNSLAFRVISVGYFLLSVPLYLALTYAASRRALGISSFQVMRLAPFYMLIPVWVTFTVVVAILSNLLQMYLLPSLTRYLKAHLVRGSSLADIRNIFNLYANTVVKTMIPTSRPFKIKNVTPVHLSKSKRRDDIRNLINVYTLRFKDIQLENDYRLDKNKKQYYENGHWYKVVFILLLLFYVSSYLIEYFVQKAWIRAPPLYSMVPTVLLICLLVGCIVVSFNHRLFIRYINQILYSLVIFMIMQHLANRFLLKSISWLHPVLFPIFTFVILRLSFVLSVISNIIFFIGTIIAATNNIHVLPLFLGINVFVGFVGYELEFKSRSNFIMEFSVVNYRKKQSELLNTMLPRSVVSKMINAKLNENGIPVGFEAESHQNVTVIFADVYNFQNLVATIEPHRLVEIMDNLFLSFDRCSKEFGAVKIETVSETYLTSMGLSDTLDKDPDDEDGKSAASLAIDMAIAMLQIASTIKINNTDSIGVKIGINTGYVISGLVGAKKPQYALFGDTVNTASRMKMTGEVGKIHISESTYDLVSEDRTLEFTSRETQVKGKGVMNTYLLEKAIGTNYPDFSTCNTIHEVDIYYNLMKSRTVNTALGGGRPSSSSARSRDHASPTRSMRTSIRSSSSAHAMRSGSHSFSSVAHSARSSGEAASLRDPSSSAEHFASFEGQPGSLGETDGSYAPDEDALLNNERDMERIRIRRTNINRAVGNEEEASFGYEPMYTSNYASSVESAGCFDRFKGIFRCFGRRRTMTSMSTIKFSESKRFFSFARGSTRRFTRRFMSNNRFSSSSTGALSKGLTRAYQTLARGSHAIGKVFYGSSKGSSSIAKGLNSMLRPSYSSARGFGAAGRATRRFGKRTSSMGSGHRKSSRQSGSLQGTHSDDSQAKNVDGIQMRRIESIFLKFRDKLQEDRYRNNFYNSPANVEVNEHALFIFLITFIVQSIVNVNFPRIFHKDGTKLIIFLNYILYWTVRCFFIVISFVLWLLFHYRFFSREYRQEAAKSRAIESDEGDRNRVIKLFTFFLNLLFVMATCVFALANSWSIRRTEEVDGNLWLTSDSIEFYFYLIILHHSTGMLFQNCLLIDSLFLVLSMTFISTSVQKTSTTVTALFTIPICVLFNLLSAHCKESIDRKTFFTNEKAYMIETRINQILNEMLPKSILEEFKQEKLKMSYVHNNMSFLFSDICGFTSWANSVDPSEVIALLQKLFANFDRNTTNFNLYKLCTIGDAYVAISEPYLTNTNDMRLNDLLNILQMAYSMLHIIQETRELFNIPNLNMRIGLHYGSCIGGVIGSGRLRYDVWGTDIYTANMIESSGIPGKVCVSESLKHILSTNFPNRFTFKFNKEVTVIDKVIKSYVIECDTQEGF